MGQTKRDLKSRVAEHKRAFKNAEPEKSALCEHLMLFDHCNNWKESTVLKYVSSYRRRLIAESWFINAHRSVINHSDGRHKVTLTNVSLEWIIRFIAKRSCRQKCVQNFLHLLSFKIENGRHVLQKIVFLKTYLTFFQNSN